MTQPLRVLLVAPSDAASAAVERLRAGGPVSPALVPSADLLRSALGAAPWDALLVLPGSAVSIADLVAAVQEVPTAPPIAVEADRRPAAFPDAILLAPGETATLRDYLTSTLVSDPAADIPTTDELSAGAEPDDGSEPGSDVEARAASSGAAASLAEGLAIGLYRSTPDGRILYANPALADLLGQPSVDALHTLDVLRDLDYPREHFAALMEADGAVGSLITTWTHPSGRRVHTRETARAVDDGTGQVYFEGTMEDVTAEVDARRADERRTRQHRAIAQFAAAAVEAETAEDLMRHASVAAQEALGGTWSLAFRHVDGRDYLATWAGPLSAANVATLQTEEGIPGQCQLHLIEDVAGDASETTGLHELLDEVDAASLAIVPVCHGDLQLGTLVVGYDAPQVFGPLDTQAGEDVAWHLAAHVVRLRAERDLADSEATLRHVAEFAGPLLFRRRFDGTFDYLAPGVSRVLGISDQALRAEHGIAAFARHREVLEGADLLHPDTAREGDALRIRYLLSDPDRTVECRARLWTSADGRPLGLVGHYQDLTDHTSPRDAAPAASLLDLGQAVVAATEAIGWLADAKGVTLDVDVSQGVWVAEDPARVSEIVTELVLHAVKYTDEGTIRVDVSGTETEASFRLSDSGPAVLESTLKCLGESVLMFEPTPADTREAETYMSDRPLDGLGGTISVRDRAPGTEVTLHFDRLPTSAPPRAPSHPAPMTHPMPPTPSGDGQPEAAPVPPRPGDDQSAFVARPQPDAPQGYGAPPTGMPPSAPQHPGFAPPPAGYAPPSAPAPPAGYAPPPPAAPYPGAPPPVMPQQQAPPPHMPQQPAPQPHAPQQHAPQPPAAPPHPGFAPAPTQGQGFAPPPSQPMHAAPQQPAFQQAPPPFAPPPSAVPPSPVADSFGAPPPAPAMPAMPAPAAPAATAPPTATATEPASDQKRRILVVEDNNDTRMLLERILRRTYDVTAVGDARSALVAMHNTRFDGLVLDINLGGKETGADILRIARSLDGYSGVFAIALTAYALPGDRERLLEKGFSEYISKPFTRSALMESLERGVGVAS